MKFLSRREALTLISAGVASPGFAQAPAWPSKPIKLIKLIVPFPPGGLIDNMARLMAPKLALELGQPVVVENKPGAGGNLGAGEAARAAPDGYTLLMASPPLTISPALYASLPYKPEQIMPIGLVGRVPNVLLVNPKSGINTVAELVARAKTSPGKLNYASNGNGTSLHLSAELFKSLSGTFVTHIPYRGAAAAVTGLISGEVDMMFDSTSSAMGQIKAGKFRALAVASPKRSAELPDVPTLVEQGVKGADVSTWYGLFVTAGTPKPVVDRLNAELSRDLALPDVQTRIKGLGGEISVMGIDQFADFNRGEFERYGKIVRDANIKAE